MRIGVVGTGIIGLTSALKLLEDGHVVSIYSSETSPNTCSDAACAIWLPGFGVQDAVGIDQAAYKRWCEDSWHEFQQLDWQRYGVFRHPAIEFFTEKHECPAYVRDLFFRFTQSHSAGVEREYSHWWEFETLMIDMSAMMRALMADLNASGISVVNQQLTGANDLLELPVDVVVLCPGLGSSKLLNDASVRGVYGQISIFGRVALSHAIGVGEYCIYPRMETTLVGSLFREGRRSATPGRSEYGDLFSFLISARRNLPTRCSVDFDALDEAHLVEIRGAMRPYRAGGPAVRWDTLNGKIVVMNYGHGGEGVSLSWGCAKEVVRLVRALPYN